MKIRLRQIAIAASCILYLRQIDFDNQKTRDVNLMTGYFVILRPRPTLKCRINVPVHLFFLAWYPPPGMSLLQTNGRPTFIDFFTGHSLTVGYYKTPARKSNRFFIYFLTASTPSLARSKKINKHIFCRWYLVKCPLPVPICVVLLQCASDSDWQPKFQAMKSDSSQSFYHAILCFSTALWVRQIINHGVKPKPMPTWSSFYRPSRKCV